MNEMSCWKKSSVENTRSKVHSLKTRQDKLETKNRENGNKKNDVFDSQTHLKNRSRIRCSGRVIVVLLPASNYKLKKDIRDNT